MRARTSLTSAVCSIASKLSRTWWTQLPDGADDVVEAGEIAHEQRLGVGAFGVEPAIGHRLAAAGLVARIDDLVAEALQQFERRDADLRKEGIDVAGNEQSYSHGGALSLTRAGEAACTVRGCATLSTRRAMER